MSRDFCTIMSNFVATDVCALFNIYVEKSATWLCKNEGGGGQGPFTQCVKKHPIWQRMASLMHRVAWNVYLISSTANNCEYMRKYCIYAPICGYAHRCASENGAWPSLVVAHINVKSWTCIALRLASLFVWSLTMLPKNAKLDFTCFPIDPVLQWVLTTALKFLFWFQQPYINFILVQRPKRY